MKKLKNDRGETLIEVLAAILVSALSVTLLFGCVMATYEMDKKARDVDKSHYIALSAADGQKGTPVDFSGATVTITRDGSSPATVPINVYGDQGMFSYKRESS